MMKEMCDKCFRLTGLTMLILGIAFLLRDYGFWTFKASAWAVVLVVFGLCALFVCPKCDVCGVEATKKGKK